MERWVGRVALVTGASAGIGLEAVRTLANLGMKVVGCARNIEKIQTLSQEVGGQGGQAGLVRAIKCDVSKEEQVTAMFEQIRADPALGGVDVCINNAGLSHPAPLLSGDTDSWRQMLDVNVLGLCMVTREAFKSMQARGVDDGQIILLNSMSGHRVIPGGRGHFYSATKFAVTALLQGIRNELRELKSHIRVASISPGVVETEFFLRALGEEQGKKEYSKLKCLEAKDITDSILYILGSPPHVEIHDVLLRPTEQVT